MSRNIALLIYSCKLYDDNVTPCCSHRMIDCMRMGVVVWCPGIRTETSKLSLLPLENNNVKLFFLPQALLFGVWLPISDTLVAVIEIFSMGSHRAMTFQYVN